MTRFLDNFCSIGLSFTRDNFRLLYFGITTFVFLCCTLFCLEYLKGEHKNRRFYIFWAITYLSVVGLLFAGDFFTLFMFFEIMSFASSVWVLQEENEESDYSGRLYLRISVICGMVMLYGLFMTYHNFGTLDFGSLRLLTQNASFNARFVPAILLFVGFGAKAGVFLLHVWLPRAHTAAPATASAVLSGILTKTGIMGIVITSSVLGLIKNDTWGLLLLVLGGCTMFTGAFLAIFSCNLKKTLACSSVSQIGFILTGIACMVLSADGFSYTGTLLHMLNHSMIKLVLFLSAGAVLKKTGSLDLNKIRGYGRKKLLLAVPFAIGAMSLAGIPGFSGYVSKTTIHEAVEALASTSEIAEVVSVVFTITGGMTLCYMLKLFVCLFVEKGEAENKPDINMLSKLSVIVPALVIFAMGILPGVFAKIPSVAVISEYAAFNPDFGEVFEMHWFAFHTMKGGLISVAIGLALYFAFVRTVLVRKKDGEIVYSQGLPKWFDLEKYVYRPFFMYLLPFVFAFFSRIFDKLTDLIIYFFRIRIFKPLKKKRPVAVGNGLTYRLGLILDGITGRGKKEGKTSFVTSLALANEQAAAMARMIERSLSLSMLLFSTGLVITLIYMLLK